MESYFLGFRRYRLPFRLPVRTGRGLWSVREGLLLRIAGRRGSAVGWGEAAPVPGFGGENVDQDEAACRALGEEVTAETLAGLPPELGALRAGLNAAYAEAGGETAEGPRESLPVAALLPAGKAGLAAISPKAEAGFRAFKWKVGTGDAREEIPLFDDLCAELPSGGRLRLDANGAWDRRTAERWLARCAERPVEFVEQPIAPTARRSEDLLLGLAADYPTPLALDESAADDGAVGRWLDAGWPGVFVLKPSLQPGLASALARLEQARARVVFSSALETAIGARAALRAAFAWRGEVRALGFGVWPLFRDARFDGPAAAPFLRRSDVDRIEPSRLWNAQS